MSVEKTTDPVNAQARPRFDSNDILFYAGLLLLGVGLAFGVSWQVACIVIGAILAAVSLVNSYVLVWLSK